MRKAQMEIVKELPSSSVELLFDGSTTLWRSRTNLDVIIAYHGQFQCLEVAICDPLSKYKVPKFYLNFQRLVAEITVEEFKEKLQSKINECIRSHQDYTIGRLTRLVQEEFVVRFILSRIAVDDKSLTIFLQAKYGDTVIPINACDGEIDGVMPDGLRLVVLIAKPIGLNSIAVTHRKLFRASQFLHCLSSFEESRKAIDINSQLAAQYIHTASDIVSNCRGKSQARKRWIKAISKVICQNLTAKFRNMLSINKPSVLRNKVSANSSAAALGPARMKPNNLPLLNINVDSKMSLSSIASPIHRIPVADIRNRLRNSFLHTALSAAATAAAATAASSPQHKSGSSDLRWLPSVRQIVGDAASNPLDHIVTAEAKSKPSMLGNGSPIRSKPKPHNQKNNNKLLSAFPMVQVN